MYGYKIMCIETGEIFKSILSASKKYGHRRIIWNCLQDPSRNLFGLHFKFVDNEIEVDTE